MTLLSAILLALPRLGAYLMLRGALAWIDLVDAVLKPVKPSRVPWAEEAPPTVERVAFVARRGDSPVEPVPAAVERLRALSDYAPPKGKPS